MPIANRKPPCTSIGACIDIQGGLLMITQGGLLMITDPSARTAAEIPAAVWCERTSESKAIITSALIPALKSRNQVVPATVHSLLLRVQVQVNSCATDGATRSKLAAKCSPRRSRVTGRP